MSKFAYTISIVAIIFTLAFFYNAGQCQDLPELEEEVDSEELSELIDYLRENPIALNQATAEELMLLPWLSPAQALRISSYAKGRRLRDPWSLEAEGLVDRETMERILPFIYLEGRGDRPTNYFISSRWQRAWAADSAAGPSPWINRQRLEYKVPGRWGLLLQSQKDKGEGDWLDYWSTSACYRERGGRFELFAGDYQLRSGMGLVFGGTNPRLLYPGNFPNIASKTNACVHTSSNEWSALRGLAAWGRMGKFSPLAAVSWRSIDGRIDSAGQLTKIYMDGYHRTESEVARRHNTIERMGVVSVAWELSGPAWLGAMGYACGYSPAFVETLRIESGASFSGGLAGYPGYLSFELAATDRRVGALNALAGTKASGTETSLLVYAYQPGYRSPRFNSYERYGGSDEWGAAIFQKIALPLNTSLSSVFHWYRPWSASSTIGKGSGGYLLDLRADNGIIKNLELGFRWRLRETERSLATDASNILGPERSYLNKATLNWKAGMGITASTGFAASRFRPATGGRERGEMLSAGMGWNAYGGLNVRIQSALFRTDSYEAAIYQAEPELKGAGSFHPLFGTGRRDALLVRYTYASRLSAELKLAYTNREYRGETVRQTEMGFQMEIR